MDERGLKLIPQDEARHVIRDVLEHLADWPIKSAETFRNVILGGGLLAINPLLNVTRRADVEFLKNTITNVVAEGRMIDFGFIPNEIIKAECVRARQPFEAGELQHPYDVWLGVTSWEGGCNGYYIAPHPQFPGETLVVEMYGVVVPNVANVVLVYDMISIKVGGPGNTIIKPATMDYVNHIETEQEMRNRGSNSLDPLVTMLRLLADASIPIIPQDAPRRLNNARAKQGKFKIPPHTKVDVRDYVASFKAVSASRGEGKGGHHASPIAHWRRSHKRTLASGNVVPVRSSKVNWRDTETMHRMFYRVKDQ